MSLLRITHDDPEAQAAFCRYVPQVFRRASFQTWCDWGLWNEDYLAFAWMDGGEVLANVSLTRMQLCLDGQPHLGWQMGAVGCLPSQRGRGWARLCMDAALEHIAGAPLLLFANPNVRGFYPRFGCTPLAQYRTTVEFSVQPADQRAAVVDLGAPAARAELLARMEQACTLTRAFGARAHGRIAAWYAANGFARTLWAAHPELWIWAGVEDDVLVIDEVIAPHPVDLRPWLGRIVARPVRGLRFGFTPEVWWPHRGARQVVEDGEADLFVRDLPGGIPTQGTTFPVLART